MSKKSKQVKSKNVNGNETEKLTINNISVGMSIPDSTRDPQDWEIDEDLIEQMRRYEQESDKSAIWRNKITGMFLYFKWIEENPQEKNEKNKPGRKPKKVEEEELEEVIEEEITDEENLILDCMADYRAEFGVKKVNINTKKFNTFFEEWKSSN